MLNIFNNNKKDTIMIDRLSEDKLTNDILNAMIRRTHITLGLLQNVEEGKHPQYYEGENFTWEMDDSFPTLTISLDSKIIFLWWNKKPLETEIEVYSNIPKDANDDLPFYIQLEKVLYDELAIIIKNLPQTEIKIEIDDFVEYEEELENERFCRI
jgi:hypothetical protein